MFSVKQKREISEKVQRILRDTKHPELPDTEIQFKLHVDGDESWSWADIENNGVIENSGINNWNEQQDSKRNKDDEKDIMLNSTIQGVVEK